MALQKEMPPPLKDWTKLRLSIKSGGQTAHLPSAGALLGKLGKIHRNVGVLPLMLLTACLDKVGICGHLALRLLGVTLRHSP